ncbi:hypothetical protein K2173_018471 [Erythroxylum novogranatense]|uniref:Fcf2 pre-rRNA processing C-terminal domain-containing protein n=1 Tax=Erythroxylum novogranatense TaxID=1862640 RepID=A0AAV8UE34_9ROSI|nr:hypothetical protein K2173_018471 [Erythroxylum novogranatense]
MAENIPVIGISWEPKLLPGLPSLKNTESTSLWKPNTELLDGLFVPPNDPTKLNRLLRNQRKDVHGRGWVEMPAPTMTPKLKRDLQLLNFLSYPFFLRNVIDPTRHYKKGDSKSKALPKYFQSSTDFFTGKLTRKERKATLADELLSDPTLRAYQEIEEKNRPAGNEKWNIKGRQSRKRAKERRQ